MTIRQHLKSIGACIEARLWARQFETAQEVYDNNTRIDWLFWWSAKTGNIVGVVKAAKEIAYSVSHLKNFDAAHAAAYAAAYAAADAATYAANAATYAANAATYVANAAADDAYTDAAYAAADAAAYTAYAAADAAAYAAADAADAAAYKEQEAKNMQIAKKYCLLPWSETLESKETK